METPGWRLRRVRVVWQDSYRIPEIEDLDTFYIVLETSPDDFTALLKTWIMVQAQRDSVDEGVISLLLEQRFQALELEDGRGGRYTGPEVKPRLRAALLAHVNRIMQEAGYRGPLKEV